MILGVLRLSHKVTGYFIGYITGYNTVHAKIEGVVTDLQSKERGSENEKITF